MSITREERIDLVSLAHTACGIPQIRPTPESEYCRGYAAAVETFKARVGGRLRAYTEDGLEDKGGGRVEAYRTVIDKDIEDMQHTVDVLRGLK